MAGERVEDEPRDIRLLGLTLEEAQDGTTKNPISPTELLHHYVPTIDVTLPLVLPVFLLIYEASTRSVSRYGYEVFTAIPRPSRLQFSRRSSILDR